MKESDFDPNQACKEIKKLADLWRDHISTQGQKVSSLYAKQKEMMRGHCEECNSLLREIESCNESKHTRVYKEAVSKMISRVIGEEIKQQTIFN